MLISSDFLSVRRRPAKPRTKNSDALSDASSVSSDVSNFLVREARTTPRTNELIGACSHGLSLCCVYCIYRLREPEQGERKRFSMMGYKYRFTGRTQYQSQQAADQITRSTQSVNRVAGDRFTWDRTLDPGTLYNTMYAFRRLAPVLLLSP